MTAEAQRIAIAEACGFFVTRVERDADGEIKLVWAETPDTWRGKDVRPWLPDFLNDLNAMHEAERTIGLHGDNFRGRMLRRSWGTYTAFLDSRFLTASERAQALLMTIKKWTNDR